MASTPPSSRGQGYPGDGGDQNDRVTTGMEDWGKGDVNEDKRALTQDRIHINGNVPKTPSSIEDSDSKNVSPRGQHFLEEDDDELPQLTRITLEEMIGIEMNYSGVSPSMEDLDIRRHKVLVNSVAVAGLYKARNPREKIKARQPKRKHSKTYEESPHNPPVQGDEANAFASTASEQDETPYDGAMNSLVEQMHGSGRSLNSNDCLKITRHSQRRYNVMRKSFAQHATSLDDSSASSNSSFAVESFHGDWTGWSSSESGNSSSEVFIVSPRDKGNGHKRVLIANDDKERKQSKPPLSKAETKSNSRRKRDSTFDSTHSAPTKGSRRMHSIAEHMEKMHSSAPEMIDHRTTRLRSIKRFQNLMAHYEIPTAYVTAASEDDGLSKALASLSSPPKEKLERMSSDVSTVKHTNGPPEADPDVNPEDHTERRSNRTVDLLSSAPTPKPRIASTSPYGYYSPWRDMQARKMIVSRSSQKVTTPKTYPLSGSPVAKPTVQAPVLSQIAPPPLSSPSGPKTRNQAKK